MMRSRIYLILALILMNSIMQCGKPDNTAIGYWDAALALISDADYKGAIVQYEKLVRHYPGDSLAAPALFAIADVYKNNLEDIPAAVKVYKRVMKKYPATDRAANALFMIGYVYANEAKDLARAEKYYRRFLKEYPQHILAPSADWELRNLGKSLDEIPELQTITQGEK